jgi:hypothetical protein
MNLLGGSTDFTLRVWPRLNGFLDAVAHSWEQLVGVSRPLQILADKFKRLSCHLQSWSQRKVGNIKEQL